MRALEDSPLLRERVNLVVVAWDDPVAGSPLDARETPQSSVNRWSGRPAECDLTIVVLWSRLGTPLPPTMTRADGSRFASGTVWEVEDAIAADRPVFVYRRTEKPRIDIDDADFEAKRSQYDAVRRWFETLRDANGARTGVNEYATPAQFQQMLRAHLEGFTGRRLAALASPGQDPVVAPPTGAPAAPIEPVGSPRATADSHAARPAATTPTRAGPTASAPPVRPAAGTRRRWLVPAVIVGMLALVALGWSLRSGRTAETVAQAQRPGGASSSTAPVAHAGASGWRQNSDKGVRPSSPVCLKSLPMLIGVRPA